MNDNIQTFSESKIKEISSRYISGVDKFRRMYAGMASNLERYENGIIYLKIENTEKKLLSSYETALSLIECWIKFNEELSQAKGFVVSFYRTISTGFAMTLKDMDSNKGLTDNLIKEFISAGSQKEHELINVFSGLIVTKPLI